MRHAKRTLGLLTLLVFLSTLLWGCRGPGGKSRAPVTRPTAAPTTAPTLKPRPTTAPTAAPTATQKPTTAPTITPTAAQKPTPTPTVASPVSEEPTWAECRQWLAASAETDVPIACPDWAFFRDELFKRGGGVFPVGSDRYYLVWFPDDWENVADRKLIVSLHGTGGCAEWMLNHWYQTSSADHSWALVALQYYDRRSKQYDDDAVIYQNLRALWTELQNHCPVAGSRLFYHGFSRGSAQSFPIAVRDRAGDQLFAAFIADSGCAGLDYPTLRDAPADALAGARFWLWCGENDVSTVDPDRMTCEVMEQDMRPFIESHGGQVDALVREAGSGHGMFDGCTQEGDSNCSPRTAAELGPSLPALFEYIESFSAQSPGTESPPSSGVTIPIGGVDPAHPQVKPLLGVISGPIQPRESQIRDLTDHLRDIGVTTIRNNDYFDDRMDIEGIFNCGGPTYPSWEGCDPQDESNYNWGPSDELFTSWLEGGFEPFLRLGGEVQNAARRHDFKGPQNATQEANWLVAAQKVVERYLHWNGAEQTFTYLDIWTEFPSKDFWDRSNADFIRFWTQVFVALKAAYPQLKIGGPGLIAGQTVKVVQGEQGVAQDFLTYLYENDVRPDWLGWHLFYNDPEMWYQAARAYRDLLDGTGMYADVPWAGTGFFDDVELIVDAYGVAKMELGPEERDRVYNRGRGAALRTASWIAMQYSDVTRAYLYRAGDPYSTPDDSLEEVYRGNYTGLFYGDEQGTYKPAAHAFRLWSQVVNGYPTLLTTPLPASAETGGLWLLAARNDRGEVALLVANITAADVSWSPAFEDGTAPADYQVTLYQVDDTHDGRTPLPWAGGAITTPANSVQLIILQ